MGLVVQKSRKLILSLPSVAIIIILVISIWKLNSSLKTLALSEGGNLQYIFSPYVFVVTQAPSTQNHESSVYTNKDSNW